MNINIFIYINLECFEKMKSYFPSTECKPATPALVLVDMERETTAHIHGDWERALSSLQACRTRAVLTAEQAIQIFRIKIGSMSLTSSNVFKDTKTDIEAQVVADAFGVSEKAVRDIWKGRTWNRETMFLDPNRSANSSPLRLPGRPRGAKTRKDRFKASHSAPKSAALDFVQQPPHLLGMTVFWDLTIPSETHAHFEVLTLPESSDPDDPFHDDWQHWPKDHAQLPSRHA